ncbi:hypothetical protein HOLleu_23499 [Holothuria leucospilota]|uniref:Uncharacterized protein n=1 Tax=Holothuria leucospilota TaxID=206669 RepID=A0A9Q1BVB4_HOLLE|nr:hypothetical protein HOLleu_23499 [Holothuria leucospilota]
MPNRRYAMSSTRKVGRLDVMDLANSFSNKVNEVDEWLRNQTRNCYENALDKACPWREVEEHDDNRIPRTVIKAVCVCEQGCINFGSNLMDSSLGFCEEVVKPTMVFRRQSANRPHIIDIELIPYACICKRNIAETTTAQ